MNPRLDLIRRRCADLDADAALLTFLPHVRWAVGFTGSNGVLVVTPDEAHFVTDGRYATQAEAEVQGAEVHVPGYRLFEHVAEAELLAGAETVLLQGDHLPFTEVERLRQLLQEVRFLPVGGLLDEDVAAKSEEEIARVRAAQAVTDEVFAAILPFIGPGVSERDLAAEIVYQHLKRGCERMAFEPIVASGLRGALPHARPTTKTLRPGELVVLDFGGVLDGYCADMTRTVAVGDPGEEARGVYQVVLDAQQAALDAAAAGRTGRDLDQAARQVIEAAGLGEHFPHSLGHGVGLEAHEWPRLSSRVEDTLPAGATVTVEPGVYLPERFGVRIEDLVVLREGGCENLTASTKELLVL
ncbi:MAG TPA: aminopeptidase P family protein [Rubricoccaceae bacterium]|nr:aminopeptidase P family protein [Rubricoccaceae bacterium]